MAFTPLTAARCALVAFLVGNAATWAAPPVLKIHGQVVMPDGKPAAGARLSFGIGGAPRVEAEADDDGQFSLAGTFEHSPTVVARSADGTMQREFTIAALEARTLAARPLRVELRPARRVTVRVMENGRTVRGAHVAVTDLPRNPELTDERGEATLHLPDGNNPVPFSVWHPELGVAGGEIQRTTGDRSDDSMTVTLQATQPRRLRLVDDADQPVADVNLFASCSSDGDVWFSGGGFPSLRAKTDAAGEVDVAWAPKLIKYCDIGIINSDWVLESIDQPKSDQPVVAHVRHKRTFQGKLIAPKGCDPTGLLIAGHSFGPGNRSDFVATRASTDGSYSLNLAPEHCYLLAVCDSKWASEPVFGVYARSNSTGDTPLPVLKVYAATPLEIRATIGPQHAPLRGVFVQLSRPVDTEWKNAAGERRGGEHAIQHWVQTDADGYIRTGLGRGPHEISIFHENWRHEQKLVVDSDKPRIVTFHKPYEGRREIRGQLTQEPKPADGFADVKVVAIEHGRRGTKSIDLETDADGRFHLETDCPQVVFFALNKTNGACGKSVATESESKVAIKLKPAATYEGQLVDGQGKPIAGATLTLSIQDAPTVFGSRFQTDDAGRFRFDHVFVEVPLRLSVDAGGQQHLLAEHYFEPGETRAGVQLRFESTSQRAEAVRHKTLRERIDVAARDARLANMHVLVTIAVEDEVARQILQRSAQDAGANPPVYEYMPVVLTSGEITGRAEDLSVAEQEKWLLPGKQQITLVALDGSGKTLGSVTVTANAPDSGKQVREFLAHHQPKVPAAQELWQAAFAKAKESDRRVLLQFGGPRCGPCFRFSRWIEEHHQQLERDYVTLKLHSGRHSGALEIEERLRGKSGSIPWTVILDADEKVLITSDSPLGNIGFPGEFESVRHFRHMLEATARRLSPADIAALAATLGKE